MIPGVGRVVRGEPFRLNGYVIPPGVEINPSIRMIHRRADLYPDAGAFRPERFLGDDAPDTYTWVPFGGGTRRCLGASFALMEMRIVLARVLERAALRAADPRARPRSSSAGSRCRRATACASSRTARRCTRCSPVHTLGACSLGTVRATVLACSNET